MKEQFVVVLVLVLVVFWFGYYVGRKTVDPYYEPEIRYVDRFLPPTSKKYDLPSSKIIYLPVRYETTRIDTVRVPKEITKYVVANPFRAIQVNPSTVSFTYYDPATLRYNTNTYTVPKRMFSFAVNTYLRYFPQNNTSFQYGIDATMWWNNLGFSTDIGYNTWFGKPVWSVGLTYNLIAF